MAEDSCNSCSRPPCSGAGHILWPASIRRCRARDAIPFTREEAAFIAAPRQLLHGHVNSDGWPYLQHRGGPAGFLKVLDPQTLGFADFKGNRQLLSTGNLAATTACRCSSWITHVANA